MMWPTTAFGFSYHERSQSYSDETLEHTLVSKCGQQKQTVYMGPKFAISVSR